MALSGFRNFFGSLGAAVGNGRESRPEDVAKVQDAMRGLGRYPAARDSAPDGIIDRGLDRAIRGYQADRRLKRDGWLAPRGETAREIDDDLGLLHLAKTPGLTPDAAESQMRRDASRFGTFGRLGERLLGGDGGFNRAKDHLDHYLSATGTPRKLTSADVEAEPALRNAARANQRLFEIETFTANSGNKQFEALLRNLRDRGPAVDISSHQETGTSLWDYLRRPGSYFALGRSGVYSELNGKAKRVGNQIAIQGWVTHRLDNRSPEDNVKGIYNDEYNFRPSQPGGAETRVLEKHGRARSFPMEYERKQPVTAILRLGSDGSPTVERVIWGDAR